MALSKIKKNDRVIVLAGKDKGRTGIVVRVIKEKNRAVVEGVNLVKKHRRGNPEKQIEGAIVDIEAPLHLSNLAVINSVTNKADRVGVKILDDGSRVRYFKSSNEVVDIEG